MQHIVAMLGKKEKSCLNANIGNRVHLGTGQAVVAVGCGRKSVSLFSIFEGSFLRIFEEIFTVSHGWEHLLLKLRGQTLLS